jgi:orotate phosphoribosyltransferase
LPQSAEEILKACGALLEGHFLLTSGRHSDKYVQCAKVFQHPAYTEALSEKLAAQFEGERIDVVVGPAMGGMILAYELARKLGARSLFTERVDGAMVLRRGFAIEKGERVIVAEDVITTGGTVRELLDIVRATDGELAGVCVLVDRSMGAIDFGTKLSAAYVADVKSWDPSECPLCKAGAPQAYKPGSRTAPKGSNQ